MEPSFHCLGMSPCIQSLKRGRIEIKRSITEQVLPSQRMFGRSPQALTSRKFQTLNISQKVTSDKFDQ